MTRAYHIFPLGDSALTIDFGNVIDEQINAQVLELFRITQALKLPGIRDLVPAYSSLTIHYDLVAIKGDRLFPSAFEMLSTQMIGILNDHSLDAASRKPEIKRIPVCYEEAFGPDLSFIEGERKKPVEEIIRLHAEKVYRVYMTGFLPGFPYMGRVDEKIAVPRKPAPVPVAAGSVGIAGMQTGIYPLASPGGWQIIGRTPVTIFDRDRREPVLLQPGDEVQFYPITRYEFENYKGRHS